MKERSKDRKDGIATVREIPAPVRPWQRRQHRSKCGGGACRTLRPTQQRDIAPPRRRPGRKQTATARSRHHQDTTIRTAVRAIYRGSSHSGRRRYSAPTRLCEYGCSVNCDEHSGPSGDAGSPDIGPTIWPATANCLQPIGMRSPTSDVATSGNGATGPVKLLVRRPLISSAKHERSNRPPVQSRRVPSPIFLARSERWRA